MNNGSVIRNDLHNMIQHSEEPRSDKKQLYYQWTADGEAEACRREQVIIDKPTECYHCGLPIPCGQATKIITLSGSAYIMHNDCADRGCYITE